MRCILAAIITAMLAVIVPGSPAGAHETDQFTLPLDKPFADMGDFLDAVHYRAIESAAAEINSEIADALKDPDSRRRRERLDALHQPWRIAEAVNDRFDDAFFEILDMEYVLRTDWAGGLQPVGMTHYYTLDWIYADVHFPLDPRGIALMFKSSTIKAYGVYFGTDKMSHFHHLGLMYYEAFLAGRALGLTDEQAWDRVRTQYDEGPISEWALLGYVATGVYSNADLAADYMGMRFYQNLTEPVLLKGEMRPPLLVVKDELYRLNKHVRPESGWFGVFVSDHWNEALNPNLYEPSIRARVGGVLRQRSERIVQFYTRVDHRPADPQWFDDYAHQLSTYDGVDYGHCQQWADIMTIGNTCWPEYARRRDAETRSVAEATGKHLYPVSN